MRPVRARRAAPIGVLRGMELAQIEKIIRDRIDELKSLEKTEHMVRVRISLQDKRDELETLLIRIRTMAAVRSMTQ
jgi:hypothetical protein